MGGKLVDMLPLQQSIQFSGYSELYDLIIPKTDVLRRINGLVDFSFIHKELMDKYCPDNGRMAESPVVMFKHLLLKTIYDISDVDVVERSRYDMSFKYFLGMTPENTEIINPSPLCKFRRLRLKDTDLVGPVDRQDRRDSDRKGNYQIPHHHCRCHAYRLQEQPALSP